LVLVVLVVLVVKQEKQLMMEIHQHLEHQLQL